MPGSVLFLLSAIVGAYLLLVGTTAARFFWSRRSAASRDRSAPLFLSIVLPVRDSDAPLQHTLETLRASDYPADQYEVIITSGDPTVRSQVEQALSTHSDSVPAVHFIETDSFSPLDFSEQLSTHAAGDCLVTLPPDASLSTEWLPAIAAQVPPGTTRITPAVTFEHNDRFLPRLQALEQVGRTAASVGGTMGSWPRSSQDVSPPLSYSGDADSAFCSAHIGAREGQVRCPAPADTLGEYVEAIAERFRDAFRGSDGTARLAEGLYGVAHAGLLIAGTVAVAVPSWRQAVLLAFLAKMAGDLLLAVPAARHFGQRGLLRSVVPTELFMVLAVPAAGVLALWMSLRESVSFN